jgi:alpha-1,2-mannosyltransferase
MDAKWPRQRSTMIADYIAKFRCFMLKDIFEDELLRIPHIAFAMLGVWVISCGIYLGFNVPLGLFEQPMGMDFYCFWSAGRLAIQGHVLDIFDPKTLAAFQQNTLNAPHHWSLPWFYPPLALLFISSIFALLPYKLAYFAYLLISLSGYYFLTRRFFPTLKPLYIVSFPAFWFNLLSGQNGLLTAVVLIGGLISLQRKPATAGATLALLSFKPQLCLVLPVFLIAERRWRAIFAGCVAFVGLVIAATAIWGLEVWTAFFAGLQNAQNFNQLDNKIKSESLAHLYGTLKTIGIPHIPAMIANYVFAVAVLCVALRICLRTTDRSIKYSVIILASLIFSPHLMYYDFVVTGAVIAWLWSQKNLRPALSLLWISPFLWPITTKFGIALLPLATAMLLYHLNKLAAGSAAPDTKIRNVSDARMA